MANLTYEIDDSSNDADMRFNSTNDDSVNAFGLFQFLYFLFNFIDDHGEFSLCHWCFAASQCKL